jgi:hypothetical protein
VVLDHRLDGEDLAWVRDHLRRCEDCRQRVDREQLLRERRIEAATSAAPLLVVSGRKRASAYRRRLADSRRYAIVAMVALTAALVGGFFVWSGPRLAADAGKPAPTYPARLATGSVEPAKPSAEPSPSAPSQPSSLPSTSQDRTEQSAVVASSHPTPVPAPSATRVAGPPPNVVLRLTYASPCCLAPLTVTADASRSTSAGGIASYEFDFGDGTRTPSTLSIFPHKYCRAGHYKLTVTVTNTVGLSSSAFVYVDVTPAVPPVLC